MHGPSQKLRDAAEQGDAELFRSLQALFAADHAKRNVEPTSSVELKEN